MKDVVKKIIFEESGERFIGKIKRKAEQQGTTLESTQKLYEKMSRGEIGGFTVPAINIRTLTFDVAKTIFRAAEKEDVGSFILELARSEMGYTDQSPREYMGMILAAAVEETYQKPIFLQGDHFKIEKKNFYSNKREEKMEELKRLITEAIKNGFYNIDIDASQLELKDNAYQTAVLSNFIRTFDKNISIGGEVNQIGGKNTTEEELITFLKEYNKTLDQNKKGIIKVAIQTGTSHGGKMLPSGKMKVMAQDFKTLEKLSKKARESGLAGAVQHGASTLPKNYFKRFPKTGACEIHLATGFQNIILDSPYFPPELKSKIYKWLDENFDKKKQETDKQFYYRTRKRALGKFKKEINNIRQDNIDKIMEELEEEFRFLFKSLKISNTEDMIRELYS